MVFLSACTLLILFRKDLGCPPSGTQGSLTALTIQVLVEHRLVFNDRLGGGHLDMTPEMVGSTVPPADHGLGRDAGHFLVNGFVAREGQVSTAVALVAVDIDHTGKLIGTIVANHDIHDSFCQTENIETAGLVNNFFHCLRF